MLNTSQSRHGCAAAELENLPGQLPAPGLLARLRRFWSRAICRKGETFEPSGHAAAEEFADLPDPVMRKSLAQLQVMSSADTACAPVAQPSGRKPPVKDDRRARVEYAVDCIKNGMDDNGIIAELAREYSIMRVEAGRLLDAAWHFIRAAHEEHDPAELLARGALQRDEVISRALSSDELRVALAAMDSRDKLLGLLNRETFESESAARSLLEVAEDALRKND